MNRKIIISLFSFILLWSVTCTIEDPVLPKWVVPFIIPVSPERLILSEELVQIRNDTGDSTIVVRGDSLFLKINGDIDPDDLTSEQLKIPGIDTTSSFNADTIEIDDIEFSVKTLPIDTVFPGLQALIGFNFSFNDTTIPNFDPPLALNSDDFQKAKIMDGNIKITFHNNLPITMGPNIVVDVISQFNDSLVAQLTITDPISPGETGTDSVNIGNENAWIYTPLLVDYALPLQGTTIFITQTLLDTANYQVDLSINDIKISEIVGKVEAQQFDETTKISVDDDNKLIRGEIESGLITYSIQNYFPLQGTINLTLYDILDANLQPFTDSLDLNDSNPRIIDLAGFTIEKWQAPGEIIDSLTVFYEVKTNETPGFVNINADDSITVSLQVSDLKFGRFEGILASDSIEIEPFEENDIIDYNGFGQGIQLSQVELVLELNNEINIDTLILNLTLKGYHKEEGIVTNSAELHIQENIETEGSTFIRLAGQNVVDFINILPTDITGSGNLRYGGAATVYAGDSLRGTYLFSTPFEVNITNPDPVQMDPEIFEEEDLDEDFREAAGDDIQSGMLRGLIRNHTPIGATVKIFVSADQNHEDLYDTTSFNPDLEFIKSATVNAAIPNNAGFITETVESPILLGLDKRELKVFQNYPLRVGFQLELQETNDFVLIRGSDFIEIAGEFEINLLIKDE